MMKTHLETVLVCILAGVICALLFFPVVFQNNGSVQWDTLELHYPHLSFGSRTLQSGTVPLWEPHLFCGYPYIGYLQAGLFYPVNLVTGLLTEISPRIVMFITIFAYWMALTGIYFLCRKLMLSAPSSMLAAITWAFSGQMLGQATHQGILQAYAVLPWILLLSIRVWKNATLANAVPGAFLLGWSLLAGHFQSALYISVFWISWLITGLWYHRTKNRLTPFRFVSIMALSLLVLFLGSGIQLIATAELASLSPRQSLSDALNQSEAFQLKSLVTLIKPDFFGAVHSPYNGPWNRTNQYCFAGSGIPLFWIAGLILFLKGFFRRSTIHQTESLPISYGLAPFLWSWICFGFLFALGPLTPVHHMATRIIPGWKLVRTPAAMMPIVAFCLSIVTAFVLEKLHSSLRFSNGSRRWLRHATWLIPLLVLTELIALYANSDLMFGDGHPYTHFMPSEHRDFLDSAYTESDELFRIHEWDLWEVMMVNEASWKGFHGTGGRISGLHFKEMGALLRLSTFNRQILDILSVKYLLTGLKETRATIVSTQTVPDAASTWEPRQVLQKISAAIYLNPEQKPRIFPVSRWKITRTTSETLDALISSDLHTTAVIHQDLELPTPSETDPAPILDLHELSHTNHSIGAQYSLDRHALLVISDAFASGWSAWLDDEPVEILRVNHAIRGVVSPAGTHTLRMQYEPITYRLGAFLWLLGFSLLGAAIFYSIRPKIMPSENRL